MSKASKKIVTETLSKNGLTPLKKFGQNFLCDQNIIQNIVDSMHLSPDDNVLEVGPGLGALTLELARRVNKVVAVEIDKGLAAVLREQTAAIPNIEIIEGDILKTDIPSVVREKLNGSFHACGNLPYYITAKCILALLESGAKSLTVMVQKEVADRLSSPPGNKIYGSLTASVQYYTQPSTLFTVSGSCFYPVPDVDSAIVQMDLSAPPLDVPREWYVRVVRAGFAMRRKTFYNNLLSAFSSSLGERSKTVVMAALLACGIAPAERAENCSASDFCSLAKYFAANV